MTIKQHNRSNTAKDLEATQFVSLDDLEELEQLQLAHADEPAKPHRAVVAAGVVFGLVLAVILLLIVLLVRSGGHS